MARFTVTGGGSGTPGPQGPQGEQGIQGEPGIQGDPGPAGADALWNFVGEYDNGADYNIGDVVTYFGGTYYRILPPNAGYVPTDPTYWDVIASPGANGADGIDGVDGAGVAAGGTAGQILAKIDGVDFNTEWIDNYTSEVKHLVKAGENLTIGQAVYVTGTTGNAGTNMIVGKASNASEATSSKTIGLIAQNLNTNDFGFVITEGLLEGLDTSAATAGDPVWLGTNGNLIFGLVNKPQAPNHLVYLGIVTRAQSNNGEIFVHVQNGFEIKEIHDVKITSPVNDKQLLVYDGIQNLWINADPIQSTGIAYKSGIPASPTSSGTTGQLAIDGANGVLYICTGTNTWQKVSLNSANFTNPGGFI